MLRFCSCASEFGRAAYPSTKRWIRCCKKRKSSGITTPSAARPQHALAGRWAEILVGVVGYGQVRGEGGGESESGCICALRVVYNTENPKKRGGSLS